MLLRIRNLLKPGSNSYEILTKSGTNLIFRIGGKALSYCFVFLVIRNYGAPIFGSWSLAITIFMVTSLLSSLGLKQAMVRIMSELNSKKDYKKIRELYLKGLRALLISSSIATILLYFLAEPFTNYLFEKPEVYPLLKWLIWSIIPYNVLSYTANCLRGMRKIREFSFIQELGVMLFAVLLLLTGMSFFDQPNFFAIIYTISSYIVMMLGLLIWYSRVKVESSDTNTNHDYDMSAILKIALPMLANQSTNFVNKWADILILGIICTNLEVGAYSLAIRITSLLVMPLMAVNSIAAPKFAQFNQEKEHKTLKEVSRKSTQLIFYLSFPAWIILLIFHEQALALFNAEFIFGGTTLIILSIGQLFNAISGSVGQLLNMTGYHSTLKNISLTTAITNVALNIILIPLYGIEGAAVATSFSIILNNGLCVYFIKKHLNFMPIYFPTLSR